MNSHLIDPIFDTWDDDGGRVHNETAKRDKVRVMICGRRGRGKDFLANLLRELVPGMERHAFADELKHQTMDMLNYAIDRFNLPRTHILSWEEHTVSDRDRYGPLWQWYGTDFVRAMDPGSTYWVRTFGDKWGHIPNLVVPDYRFPNEGEWGWQNGFVLVRVTGPSRRSNADGRDDKHASEANIDTLPTDLVYENNGSRDDMRAWVKTALLPLFATTQGHKEH